MPKTLLLADDSVTIQKVVGISFANEDVRLVTVDNGDDALARARELRPDIVLADVVMPGMNGYEVCEAIKSDDALRHIPVLLLTGTFEAFDDERARRAGADGHVTKPFEAQALVDLVNARLAAAAAPAPAAEPAPAPASQAATARSTGEDGALDFFDDVTAPDAEREAPEPAAPHAAPDPAATTTVLASPADDDLRVDPDGGAGFSFDEAPDDLHDALPAASRPAPAPAPETAQDATVALFDDEDDAFSNAETLPPVDAGAPESDPFAATRVVTDFGAEGAEPWPAEPEADDALLAEEPEPPFVAPPSSPEALGAVGPDEFADAGMVDAAAARDYDVSSSDLGDPLADAPAAPARFEPEPAAPAARFEPAPAARVEPGPAPAPAGAVPELSPVFRQQIQDALEKVAWEAFGDLAEKLVRDTLDRVEKVAWEVVPQMAETLIQEEIRRLKSEDD